MKETTGGEKNWKRESFYDFWEQVKKESSEKFSETPKVSFNERILLEEQHRTLQWKIVLVGDGAVGKTSLRRRYIGEGFSIKYQQTVGADFSSYRDEIGVNVVKFVIWDLAGQPRFQEVRKSFYTGCQGALIVYDITNLKSFENIKNWINEVWVNNGKGPIPFVIVANKIDLKELIIPTVSDNQADFFAKKVNQVTRRKYGFEVNTVLTSARTSENVNTAFKKLGIQIIAHNKYIERKYNQFYS